MDARKNVLICEDDPVQLTVLTAAFRMAGYHALGARSPAEALRTLDLGGVDAVVADVQLEGGSAFDVLGNLRRNGLEAPVFMASAYATPNLRERARAAGVMRFFEKPYAIMDIVRSVGRALKERVAGGSAGRVLVVEDHAPARAVAGELIGEQGFEALVAEDGARALEVLAAAKRPVDLVLMDVNVPGPSGAELVRRIRAADAAVEIVMLAGEASHEEIVEAYAEGASSLLRKPYSEEELLRIVRAHAAIGRKRRAAAEREERARADRPVAPWTRRVGHSLRSLGRRRWTRVAALVLATLAAGAALAQTIWFASAAPEVRIERQMLDEMRRFSDGYEKELRHYGIAR